MTPTRTLLPGALLALALTGCASTPGEPTAGPAPTGTNRPTAPPTTEAPEDPAAGESEPTEEDLAEPTEEPEDPELAFGDSTTYEDGLTITVGKPQPYRPSDTAAFEKSAAYRKFEVTIVNNTGKRFDPSLFTTTLQSSNKEGDEVFDSGGGIEGAPSTTLLNGREAKFEIAYGLADPDDIVLEVSPSFEHNASVYLLQK